MIGARKAKIWVHKFVPLALVLDLKGVQTSDDKSSSAGVSTLPLVDLPSCVMDFFFFPAGKDPLNRRGSDKSMYGQKLVSQRSLYGIRVENSLKSTIQILSIDPAAGSSKDWHIGRQEGSPIRGQVLQLAIARFKGMY